MTTNTFKIPVGSTSNILHVFLYGTSFQSGVTGIAYNTASLSGRYVRQGEAESAALTFEDITTLGTYQAPTDSAHLRIKKIDDTNMPGLYELHLPDAWFIGTPRFFTLQIGGAAGVQSTPVRVELWGMNPYDSQRAGLTALPAADAGKTGGLSPAVVTEGLCQGGATQTVTLAAGETPTNDLYMGCLIHIYSGTGAGQVRVCIGFTGSSKIAVVDCPWQVVPDGTSRYRVLSIRAVPMDGNMGVPVQSLEIGAVNEIWSYLTSNITTAGSIGKLIVDEVGGLMGANSIETGWNAQQALRVILAVLAGNVGGGGSTQNTIRDVNNIKDRVRATVDSNGNRTVTYVDGS